MRKILLFFVIILSAFNIYASSQWIYIASSSDDTLFFIDANSIQQSGDSYTFWTKFNLSKRDDDGNLSSKSQRTINCRTRETVGRYIIYYDDIDGNGKITSSFSSKLSWTPIPPESINSAYYSYVCKK